MTGPMIQRPAISRGGDATPLAGRPPDRAGYWIIGHALFWLICAWLQFPRSYWDDSLIIGPAVGLVDGHGLRSVYLSAQFYPATHYLFYPPTFFWALAGWIAAFGRGVASLSLFWAACGLGISVPAGALLARFGRSGVGHAVAPMLVFGCIAYTGFRYEILALATLFCGIACGLSGRRFAGYLLLCITPTIAPGVTGCSIVAIGALLLRGDFGRRDVRLAALALMLAALWLWASVTGDVLGLVQTMYRYRAVRIGVGGRAMEGGVLLFVIATNMLAVVVTRLILHRGWGDRLVQGPLLLTAAWALTVATHARPTVLVALNMASATVCLVVLATLVATRFDRPAHAARIALAAFGLSLGWLNLSYVTDVAIRPLSPGAVSTARTVAASAPPGYRIVADARVMREALHLPGGGHVEDAMIRHAWPDIYQDYHRIPAGEVWVVTSTTLLGGSVGSLTRGLLDQLFISPGMKWTPTSDAVCRLDAVLSARWRSKDRAELVALACKE